MQKVKAFGDWLTKWFTAIVIVWAVFNYFVPQASLWGKSYTGYFLGIVLFGMGLTLTLDDFRRILTQPLMVIVGTVAHFVIMPLVAVLLCWIFRLDGALAVGVILVGCCPSGTSSNVMSYLSRGDVALDVSIGILSTLCAPFMIPLLMQWLASQYVSVPVESLFLNAVKVVLFPIALGVICHAIFGEKIEKITVALPIVSQVAILLIIGVVVGNRYLDKIDIDPADPSERTTLQVDPEVKKEESELKKKASKKYQQDFDNADEAIAKNIKSGTVWYHKDVFNLLLVGSDTRNPQYYSRSDSMILISVNKRSQQIKMVSLLRAAYVSIPGHGNARLNAA